MEKHSFNKYFLAVYILKGGGGGGQITVLFTCGGLYMFDLSFHHISILYTCVTALMLSDQYSNLMRIYTRDTTTVFVIAY